MLYVCVIFLFTFLLNEIVHGNSTEDDNCTSTIDIPLITHLNAPLKAELDISILTEQLKELIGHEVKQAVSVAMKDIVEKIVDKRARSSMENLQTFNNLTISTFLQEMEVTMEKNYATLMSKLNISTNDIHYLTTKDDKLEEKIDQMKENQTFTESRMSRVESDVIKNTERVAVSLYPVDQTYTSGSIIMFNSIWTSTGINNERLADIRNKGYFTCDKPGIYLIAISLVTHSPGKIVHLFKNSLAVKQIRLTHDSTDETTTLTLLLQLDVGDTLRLKAGGEVYIHGKAYSELTILKITT